MNNWPQPIKKAAEEARKAGLWQVATHFNTIAEPLVPIDTGNLRQAMYVEMRGNVVYSVTGPRAPGLSPDANVGEYVSEQYYGKLRHAGIVGAALLSVVNLHPDALTGNRQHERLLKSGRRVPVNTTFGRRKAGSGHEHLYRRARELAIELGQMTKQEPALWDDRISKRPSFRKEAEEILVRFFA